MREKIIRNGTGGRAIVVVGIVEPVGVELELAVVEVEDRRVLELAISIRIIVFTHPRHQSLRVVLVGNKTLPRS